MSEQTRGSASSALPEQPSLEWLRKEAKRRLDMLRKKNRGAKLADAQLDVARQYGFASWRALKAHIDALTLEGQAVGAAREGDAAALATLLDSHPELMRLKAKPYGMSLLHLGAPHLGVVDLLLDRGMDPDTREGGDNTTAMHWAAAAGNLDVVRRLADAGADVVGHGDDHELEIIGWATSWDGCDDDAHRQVADFLVSRGATHHIFSAIAMRREDEVRRIVAQSPGALSQRMSRNEDHQLPLHFAVRMRRPAMVTLLIELGADPLGTDASGNTAAAYAITPDADRAVMERVRAMTNAEWLSAERGRRSADVRAIDLVAALSLRDDAGAERVLRDKPALTDAKNGVLHLMAKRGDVDATRWLLAHGADLNGRWSHWGADVTPLHLATLGDHVDVARVLIDAGADSTIKDSQHDSDALGWAEFFGRREIVALLQGRSNSQRVAR